MSDKTFEISLDGYCTLGVDEIWANGDAPENPTIDDVIAEMRKQGVDNTYYLCRDWNVCPDTVYVDGVRV